MKKLHWWIGLPLEEVKKNGFDPVGQLGVINFMPLIKVHSPQTIEEYAKRAIEEANKENTNFKYEGFAAFYRVNDSSYEEFGQIVDDSKETSGLHLLVVQPLKKREK